MNLDQTKFDYDWLKSDGTGQIVKTEGSKVVICPIDKYEIIIQLSPLNEFMGILGVRINTRFISPSIEKGLSTYHDVDTFYQE